MVSFIVFGASCHKLSHFTAGFSSTATHDAGVAIARLADNVAVLHTRSVAADDAASRHSVVRGVYNFLALAHRFIIPTVSSIFHCSC